MTTIPDTRADDVDDKAPPCQQCHGVGSDETGDDCADCDGSGDDRLMHERM